MTNLLEARALRKVYDSDGTPVEALRGIDLVIEHGTFTAIMGPSGCGKSTLLHLLGGLDRPTSGDVLLEDTSLYKLPDASLTLFRRHRVGFVFQFFNLVPVLTAGENVGLPAVIDGKPDPGRVCEVLGAVGVAEVGDKLPSQISGGQQQRVAIARALMMKPAVILADEPTGNLDYRSSHEVMGVLADLNERGQTVVVVTHDPNVAGYAGRAVFLRDGRVADETDATHDPAALVARLVALDEPEPV